MAEIVASDLPFRRVTAHTTDAIEVFRRQGFTRKVLLLESIGDLYTHYYTLGDTVDYFYSALLLRTGQLTVFDLVPSVKDCCCACLIRNIPSVCAR